MYKCRYYATMACKLTIGMNLILAKVSRPIQWNCHIMCCSDVTKYLIDVQSIHTNETQSFHAVRGLHVFHKGSPKHWQPDFFIKLTCWDNVCGPNEPSTHYFARNIRTSVGCKEKMRITVKPKWMPIHIVFNEIHLTYSCGYKNIP